MKPHTTIILLLLWLTLLFTPLLAQCGEVFVCHQLGADHKIAVEIGLAWYAEGAELHIGKIVKPTKFAIEGMNRAWRWKDAGRWYRFEITPESRGHYYVPGQRRQGFKCRQTAEVVGNK